MERQIIPFTTEEDWLSNRVNDLTSSDIPSLFGVGYQTWQEVWYSKKNKIQTKIEETERIFWGRILQDSIAWGFSKKNKWGISKKTEYIRIPELRIGSSFDYEIHIDQDPKTLEIIKKYLLEIKNVDSLEYKKKFIQGFEIEASPYIELQVQHQLLVSGFEKAYIGILVGGNKSVLLKREANPKVQQAILKKAAEFWRSIDESK